MEMQGIEVGMLEMGMGMWEIWVVMRGMRGMWGMTWECGESG